MSPERLRQLLQRVKAGETQVADALGELRTLPYQDLGSINIDHHRALRQGVPEVVLGEAKTAEQIAAIVGEMDRAGHNVLVTRLSPDKAEVVAAAYPEWSYSQVARLGQLAHNRTPKRPAAPVAVICAGTSDVSVAEEAALTLQAVGLDCVRMFDVGVAGIHRLFGSLPHLEAASAAIVIAGMEGALPSVVGGLVACPVIAVPTSIGYGTALGGLTALFAMLTSCAAGLTVVNIDNGFGAAMAVHRMLPKAEA